MRCTLKHASTIQDAKYGPITLAEDSVGVGEAPLADIASLIRLCLPLNIPVLECFDRLESASELIREAHTTVTSVSS